MVIQSPHRLMNQMQSNQSIRMGEPAAVERLLNDVSKSEPDEWRIAC